MTAPPTVRDDHHARSDPAARAETNEGRIAIDAASNHRESTVGPATTRSPTAEVEEHATRPAHLMRVRSPMR